MWQGIVYSGVNRKEYILRRDWGPGLDLGEIRRNYRG